MPRKKSPHQSVAEEKAVIVRVPPEWHDWLRDRAHDERTHISELVRKALEATYDALPKRDPPDKGRKGGEFVYPPLNPHTADCFADHS